MRNQLKRLKKMMMKTDGCKMTITKYSGVIPKSGASVIEFAGIKLVHRSIKSDKSDYLVHQATGAIIRAYPMGTPRDKVLDDLANNLHTLKHFIDAPEGFDVELKPKTSVKEDKPKESVLDKLESPHNISWTDIIVEKVKKVFNVKDLTW